MELDFSHVVLKASDVEKFKKFYVEKLGFEKIDESPQSFAFRAGGVRYSVMSGGKTLEKTESVNSIFIFQTMNIVRDVAALKDRGITFDSEILQAPGFMKFINFSDPDNNKLELGEYLRDPIKSNL